MRKFIFPHAHQKCVTYDPIRIYTGGLVTGTCDVGGVTIQTPGGGVLEYF